MPLAGAIDRTVCPVERRALYIVQPMSATSQRSVRVYNYALANYESTTVQGINHKHASVHHAYMSPKA